MSLASLRAMPLHATTLTPVLLALLCLPTAAAARGPRAVMRRHDAQLRARGLPRLDHLLRQPYLADPHQLPLETLGYLNARLRQQRGGSVDSGPGSRAGRPRDGRRSTTMGRRGSPRPTQSVQLRRPLDRRYNWGVRLDVTQPSPRDSTDPPCSVTTGIDLALGKREVRAHCAIRLGLPTEEPQRARAIAEYRLHSALSKHYDGRYELVDVANPRCRLALKLDFTIVGDEPAHARIRVPWQASQCTNATYIPLHKSTETWAHEATHFMLGYPDEYLAAFSGLPRRQQRLMASVDGQSSPKYLLGVARALRLATGRRFCVVRTAGSQRR